VLAGPTESVSIHGDLQGSKQFHCRWLRWWLRCSGVCRRGRDSAGEGQRTGNLRASCLGSSVAMPMSRSATLPLQFAQTRRRRRLLPLPGPEGVDFPRLLPRRVPTIFETQRSRRASSLQPQQQPTLAHSPPLTATLALPSPPSLCNTPSPSLGLALCLFVLDWLYTQRPVAF
jgi:hypothetical protein